MGLRYGHPAREFNRWDLMALDDEVGGGSDDDGSEGGQEGGMRTW